MKTENKSDHFLEELGFKREPPFEGFMDNGKPIPNNYKGIQVPYWKALLVEDDNPEELDAEDRWDLVQPELKEMFMKYWPDVSAITDEGMLNQPSIARAFANKADLVHTAIEKMIQWNDLNEDRVWNYVTEKLEYELEMERLRK